MPKKVFIKKAMSLTIINIFLRTIGVSYSVWLANKVGGEGMGLYQLVMSIYMPAVTLASSGMSLATTRITAEEKAFGNISNIKRGVNQAVTISLVMGAISAFILYFAAGFIGNNVLFEERTITPIRMLSVALPFLSCSNIIRGYFVGIEKPICSVAGDLTEQLFVLLSTVIIITNIKSNNLEYLCCVLAGCSVVGEILSCVVGLVLYKISLGVIREGNKGCSMLKRIAKISLPLAWSGYLRSCLSSVESILIPFNLKRYGASKEEALSQYGIIRGMAIPTLMFPSVVLSGLSTLLLPEVSKVNVTSNYNRLKYVIKKSIITSVIFSLVIMILVIMFFKQFSMILYNNDKVGVYFFILAGMIPIEYVDMIIDSILKGLDKQTAVMWFSIVDSSVSILLIIMLVPYLGVKGYIIMLYIGSILNGFLGANYLLKILKQYRKTPKKFDKAVSN